MRRGGGRRHHYGNRCYLFFDGHGIRGEELEAGYRLLSTAGSKSFQRSVHMYLCTLCVLCVVQLLIMARDGFHSLPVVAWRFLTTSLIALAFLRFLDFFFSFLSDNGVQHQYATRFHKHEKGNYQRQYPGQKRGRGLFCVSVPGVGIPLSSVLCVQQLLTLQSHERIAWRPFFLSRPFTFHIPLTGVEPSATNQCGLTGTARVYWKALRSELYFEQRNDNSLRFTILVCHVVQIHTRLESIRLCIFSPYP